MPEIYRLIDQGQVSYYYSGERYIVHISAERARRLVAAGAKLSTIDREGG